MQVLLSDASWSCAPEDALGFEALGTKKKTRGNERPELDRRQRATKMSGEQKRRVLRLLCDCMMPLTRTFP